MTIRTLIASASAVFAFAMAAPIPAGDAQTPTPAPAAARTFSNVSNEVSGMRLPDSKMARDVTKLVRDAEGDLLFQHSVRVYYWAALAGKRKGLSFDPELLYVASMFHDFGLTSGYGTSHSRFEVDGANAARDFLRKHGVSDAESQNIWFAIALHTTNGISPHLFPIATLLAEGANMDLIGAGYDDFTAAERSAVEAAHPHPPGFADAFMQAAYDSLKHRPETTQGTGLADIMAYEDPGFVRRDFSRLMLKSRWDAGK